MNLELSSLKFYLSAGGNELVIRGPVSEGRYADLANLAEGFIPEGRFHGVPKYVRVELTVRGHSAEGGVFVDDLELADNIRRSEVLGEMKIAAITKALQNLALLESVEKLASKGLPEVGEARLKEKLQSFLTTSEAIVAGEGLSQEELTESDVTTAVSVSMEEDKLEDVAPKKLVQDLPVIPAPMVAPVSSPADQEDESELEEALTALDSSQEKPEPSDDASVTPFKSNPNGGKAIFNRIIGTPSAHDKNAFRDRAQHGPAPQVLARSLASRIEPDSADYAEYVIPQIEGLEVYAGSGVDVFSDDYLLSVSRKIDMAWNFSVGVPIDIEADPSGLERDMIIACWLQVQRKGNS